jgi:cytidine deaminase
VAICNAVAAGQGEVVAIAVYTPGGGAAPCGACRQFIIEFGEGIVVLFDGGDGVVQLTIGELLPHAFTKASLTRGGT